MKPTVSNSSAAWSFPRGVAAGLALLAVLAIAAQDPAVAASDSGRENRLISDAWFIGLGGYLTDFNTTAAVGAGGALGTVVSLEDQLDLDPQKTFLRADGFYRFNSRHAMGFGYWDLKRSGLTTLADQIEWDGNIYDVGADISSEFNLRWIRLDWRYSFLRNDRGEAGLNLGLSTYDMKAKLDGDATVGMMTQMISGEETLLAPVPTIGMFITFAVTPNVLFRGAFNYLRLQTGDIEGGVTDTLLVFEWYFSQHFGVGGGAARTGIEYQNNGSDPATINFSMSGFVGYLTFVWGDVD